MGKSLLAIFRNPHLAHVTRYTNQEISKMLKKWNFIDKWDWEPILALEKVNVYI